MKTHDQVIKALMKRPGVGAEVDRMEREETGLLDALLKLAARDLFCRLPEAHGPRYALAGRGQAVSHHRKRPLNGAFLRFWRAERWVSSETRYEWLSFLALPTRKMLPSVPRYPLSCQL